MLQVGEKADGALSGVLVDKPGSAKQVKLSALWKDKIVILYFYPKDLTPGCTVEAENFQNKLSQIEKLGAMVIGCSRDDEKLHSRFMEKKSLEFPLLSDNTGSITEHFGVWGEKKLYGKTYMGIHRSTFIIQKGKIIHVYPKVKVKEHADEVISFLKELKK